MLGHIATDTAWWAVAAGVTLAAAVTAAVLLGRARRSRAPDHTHPASAPYPVLIHHMYRGGASKHVNGHPYIPPTPPPPAAADPAPGKPLTLAEMSPAARKLVTAMATSMGVLVVALIALGLLGSFTTQVRVVKPWFGAEFAWIVPVVADVGAIVLIQGDFLLTLYGMRIRWLRIITSLWLLGTLALNLSAAKGGGLDEYVGHALLPLVVIVFTELARALLARWAKLQAPDTIGGYEPLPKVRWLLQPVQTWLLWRRRQLLGLHSLQAVSDAEARYALAKGHLRAEYGWGKLKLFWRLRAPREVMWALKRDLLMGRGADEVAAIVSARLFGEIKRGMQPSEGQPAPDPAPDLDPADAAAALEAPAEEAPKPPAKTKPVRVPAQRRRTVPSARPVRPAAAPASDPATEGKGGPVAPQPGDDAEWESWSDVVRHGYQMYERHRLTTGEEIDCKTIALELDSNDGYLRTVRSKKWRPRYARLHPYTAQATETIPATPDNEPADTRPQDQAPDPAPASGTGSVDAAPAEPEPETVPETETADEPVRETVAAATT